MFDPDEWTNWESGDALSAPPDLREYPTSREIIRNLSAQFRRVFIDWEEGDRWVNARIVKAGVLGYTGLLMDAEKSLLGQSVLVSVSDTVGGDPAWVKFYMTPDTSAIELHYPPVCNSEECRTTAKKIAMTIGYDFVNIDSM